MTTLLTSGAPDGRRQRSERSKQAIIEAMLAMIQQIFDAPQVDLSLLGA